MALKLYFGLHFNTNINCEEVEFFDGLNWNVHQWQGTKGTKETISDGYYQLSDRWKYSINYGSDISGFEISDLKILTKSLPSTQYDLTEKIKPYIRIESSGKYLLVYGTNWTQNFLELDDIPDGDLLNIDGINCSIIANINFKDKENDKNFSFKFSESHIKSLDFFINNQKYADLHYQNNLQWTNETVQTPYIRPSNNSEWKFTLSFDKQVSEATIKSTECESSDVSDDGIIPSNFVQKIVAESGCASIILSQGWPSCFADFQSEQILISDILDVTFVKEKITLKYSLEHCTANIIKTEFESGDSVNIVLSCDIGYNFTHIPVLKMDNKDNEFKLNDDKTKCTITIVLTRNAEIIAKAESAIIPEIHTSNFIDIFILNNEDVQKIKEMRWIFCRGNSESNMIADDINNNISAIYKTFIDPVPSGEKLCKIAGYNTNLVFPYTDSLLYSFDSEKIHIDELYKNALDYAPYTSAEIYLPFIGLKSLEINKIMDKNLLVTYNCNIIDCSCEVMIKADDNLIDSFNGFYGYKFPFRSQLTTNVKIDSTKYCKDLIPSLMIYSKIPIEKNPAKKINQIGVLSSFDGFIKGEIQQFNNSIFDVFPWLTKNEIDLIQNQLSNGILI